MLRSKAQESFFILITPDTTNLSASPVTPEFHIQYCISWVQALNALLFVALVKITVSYIGYCSGFVTGPPATIPPPPVSICRKARVNVLKCRSDLSFHCNQNKTQTPNHGHIWSGTWLFQDVLSFCTVFSVLPPHQPLSLSLSLFRAIVFALSSH